jgi:hypothetical protein
MRPPQLDHVIIFQVSEAYSMSTTIPEKGFEVLPIGIILDWGGRDEQEVN